MKTIQAYLIIKWQTKKYIWNAIEIKNCWSKSAALNYHCEAKIRIKYDNTHRYHIYARAASLTANYTRVHPIRSLSRRTTQERGDATSGGSVPCPATDVRVADNWHPLPVLRAIQRSSLKKKRGARALIACPAFTQRPVSLAMCSQYMEHNTHGHAGKLPSCEHFTPCVNFFWSHMVSGLLFLYARDESETACCYYSLHGRVHTRAIARMQFAW